MKATFIFEFETDRGTFTLTSGNFWDAMEELGNQLLDKVTELHGACWNCLIKGIKDGEETTINIHKYTVNKGE